MSWFDTSGLASIAKSALKEAQRTIDKALDIKDEDINSVPVNTPIDTNADDFFGTWNINHGGGTQEIKKIDQDHHIVTRSPVKSSLLTTSLWGSFTGSFFEAHKDCVKNEDSTDILDDSIDIGNEHFSSSKLVVQQSDDGDGALPQNPCNLNEELIVDGNKNADTCAKDKSEIINKNKIEITLGHVDQGDVQVLSPTSGNQTVRKMETSSNVTHNSNRLSVISTESGKNSSESVEVLTETGCTTTPDSEVQSISTSSSALGLRHTSESVEVLPDSLTSPSSVEVLGSESSSSRRQSQYTDEFLSPLESPFLDDITKSSVTSEKISPDSVEVIPEDQEENSIAEDTVSYTSISECTSATVLDTAFNHAKSQKLLKDMNLKMEAMNDSLISDVSLSPDKSFVEPITRAPSRSGMHLPLPQVTTPQLIDTQPQSSLKDLSELIKNSNIIDIPQDHDNLKSTSLEMQEGHTESSNDEGSQSDKTMIASDNIMESSSDTSTATDNNSTYLKTMLADAMTEKSTESDDVNQYTNQYDLCKSTDILENISITQLEMPQREASPLSSESRSDLVKVGSDHTSGHTSGDELETTTSSDIEIISSPNGDSSSTQSRQSPAKQTIVKSKTCDANVDVLLGKMTFQKIKGHNRELSEASSVSDDSHSSEVEKLIKRISEMTEILELREAKLIEVNRRNVELQEMNYDLKRQLDTVLTKQIESADLSLVTEEYTQRLSALEKKFQQAIRDKDLLRKQLEQSKQEAATRLTKGELETIISEKDEIIKELREEGEKLSKQQLQHSNIIKKLRSKEKEQENTIKHLKDTIEDLSSETERLKRSLMAKEEVERSQIEAVHQLTAKNKKLEHEASHLQEQLDDLTQKYDTVKKSLDAAKKELVDKNKTSSELIAREHLLQSLQNEKRMIDSQNEEIINQLEDMRMKLQQADQEYLKKEQMLRSENSELLRRIEEAEQRNEELAQSVLEVGKPLIRQLETLQATHNIKVAQFEKLEQTLTLKTNELQNKLQSLSDNEKLAREECVSLRSRISSLEKQLNSTHHENDMLKMQVEQQKTKNMIAIQDLQREIGELREQLKHKNDKIENQTKEVSSLQHLLSLEKTANEAEKRRNLLLQEQMREKGESGQTTVGESSPVTGNTSPTLSLGRVSLSESLGSSFWQSDEQFEPGPVPRYTNMFEMQMLQTNLRQREGEVQQLQWELNRREHERTLLNSEISELLTRVENLESKLQDHETVKTQFSELQQQYDTLCQLYGEKVEEAEELKLDLEDVKDMYKSQIDELLKQQKQNH